LPVTYLHPGSSLSKEHAAIGLMSAHDSCSTDVLPGVR
jgi:hypothetical protein